MIQQCNTFLFTCLSYVLTTYLIYFGFTLILTIFGSILVYFLNNREGNNWNLSKIEYFLISYCIGIAIYVFYGYVLDILKTFNFFTAFLAIVIIDVLFLSFLAFKGKIKEFKKTLKESEYKYPLIFFGLILFFEIYRVYIVYAISTSLESSDPYQWTASVWYLIDNQQLTHVWFDYKYPSGFTIFCAGHAFLAPSKTIIYYFMKIASMPLLTIMLMGTVSFSHRLFNNRYIDFFCLIIILSANYFLTRMFSFIASSLATLFVLVVLLIFLTEIPNWFIGILMPAIYLIHNLTALFLIGAFFLYYVSKLLMEREEFKKNFNEMVTLLLISLVLLIPYFLHAFYYWNVNPIEIALSQIIKMDSSMSENVQVGTRPMLLQSYINEEEFLFLRLDKFHELAVRRTIGLFFFFSIFGLFISIKMANQKERNTILHLKIGVFLTIAFYYIPYLLSIDLILNNRIYSFAYLRFTETFAIHIIMMAALFLNYIIDLSKKLWTRIMIKYKKARNYLDDHKTFQKFLNLPNLVLFLILFSSITFFIARERFYYKYEHRYMGENLLYLVEDAPKGSNILVRDFDYDDDNLTHNRLFYLLYEFNVIYYNSSDFNNYLDFYDFCASNNCSYILIRKEDFSQAFQEDLDQSNELIKVYQECEGASWYGVYELIP